MKNYNPTKENKYIMHLDGNHLYGWEMGPYIPYCEFKQVKNVDNLDIN